MMHKLQVLLVVACVAVGPALAQITFSRSWVPQGKRSGGAWSPQPPEGPAPLEETCRDAYVGALMQVAAVLNVGCRSCSAREWACVRICLGEDSARGQRRRPSSPRPKVYQIDSLRERRQLKED
ncbi:uncharacterized protein LOC122266467 [Penaeus japonicus]|uniref:uncharacterized protein LOC122266467 n=1 Tax=Penaeus japonicus TaxID=27405 RepID=UPI001C717530|nr:uncharacterized protein LOC122266467 [Penaeus japonicus]